MPLAVAQLAPWLSKLMFYGFLLVVILSVSGFVYWRWKTDIQTAAANKIFQEQSEQHLKNVEDEQKRMAQANQLKDAELKKFIEQQQQITRSYQDLLKKIQSGQLKDGELAPVLEYTLKEILRRQGSLPEAAPASVAPATPQAARKAPEVKKTAPKEANPSIDRWKKK